MAKPTKPRKPSAHANPYTPPQRSRRVAAAGDTPGPAGGMAAEFSNPVEKLCKITGIQAVTALFHTDPRQVMRLYYDKRWKNTVGPFCSQLARWHRPYRMVDAEELSRIAGTVLHGGIVAAAKPRSIPALDIATARRWGQSGSPLLILDGVSNPHNVGAIARTAVFFGLQYLVISDHPAQAGLSDAAHRIAEGGLEFLAVYQALRLPQTLKRLQGAYRVIGTAIAGRAMTLAELADDGRPMALVLGNEEQGLSAETLEACETIVTIKGAGKIQSLNVSATAAILVHEMTRRRYQACDADRRLDRTHDTGNSAAGSHRVSSRRR